MYLKVGAYLDFVYGDGKFLLHHLMELWNYPISTFRPKALIFSKPAH